MQVPQVLKTLLSLLTTDLADLGRTASERKTGQYLPEAIQSALAAEVLYQERYPDTRPRNSPELIREISPFNQANPAIRLMEVLSALPPAQLPAWFKQRFAGEPLFELREFRELTPAQRRQVLVLLEKTLSARPLRAQEPVQDAMSSFLQAARQV